MIPQDIKQKIQEACTAYENLSKTSSKNISVYRSGLYDGYHLYQQERDELRKEVERITECLREVERLEDEKQSVEILLDACKSANELLSKEVERLKGLIEDAYDAGFRRATHINTVHGNGFDFLLSGSTTQTFDKFKQKNKL